MAGTNVPQPTFGPNGFIIPSTSAVLAGVIADIQQAFGNTLNLSVSDPESLTTPQGQLATSWAAVINNVYAEFLYYTNQVDPAYAIGRMQDAIARIYFLERNPAEPTALQIVCSGLAGVVIPAGTNPATIQDTSGNLYACTEAATIGAGGTVTTSFACTVPGPVAVPSEADVSIYQAIFGWDSVTVSSGVEGVDTESRQAFELRREDSVAGNSTGPVGAIIGAVAKVSGVLDYYGYNNNTAGSVTVGGVLIAAYSIYICVAGGAASAIASAIFSKKGPGAPMTGTTTVTVYDDNPLYPAPIPYQISFQIPTPLQLLFNVTIVQGPNIPANAAALIQAALIAAVTQGVLPNNPQVVPNLRARIGQPIYATTYVQVINALGAWAQVAAIGIGSANAPGAVVVGTILGTTLTVTSVITGALVVGQTLSDTTGAIILGTQITAFGSGVGGVGTYTVSNSQTLAGASFTGSGVSTTLTVSGITGTIVIGDVIIGTGVPSNTTIVAQLTGPAGGNGTYQTSGATTASGTITTAEFLSGASGNQASVSVNANQEPQLSAVNITVGVT